MRDLPRGCGHDFVLILGPGDRVRLDVACDPGQYCFDYAEYYNHFFFLGETV